MSGALPEHVERFLAQHISSVEQLEILLVLVHAQPGELTAAEIARELRISERSTESRLADFVRRGLVARRADRFRYAPSPAHHSVVSELADLYPQRRVTIITFIFSKPVEGVHLFADAFRLRKDDEK